MWKKGCQSFHFTAKMTSIAFTKVFTAFEIKPFRETERGWQKSENFIKSVCMEI